MFNPLLDNLASLTEAELEARLSDLSRKYFMSSNPSVQEQLQTVIEQFKQELYVRQEQNRLKEQNNDENDLDNLINIS